MEKILAWAVFGPMVCSVFSYAIGRKSKKSRDRFVLAVTLVEMALVLAVLLQGELTLRMEKICGLGIEFVSGGFHSIMALLAATGWVSATLLSWEYFVHLRRRNRYYVFWLLTLGATVGVFLSADLYTTFLFFEIMSFTSYVAVVHTEEADAQKAGETYLAVAVIGGLITLSGLFLLYHQLDTLHFAQLAEAAAQSTDKKLLWIGGLLTLVGFGAKAGVFPLHIWLPTAHPAAPAPASAVLSGVITKTGIYGVAVLSSTLFLHNQAWGMLLAALGAVTMTLGAVLAVCSTDLKRTLACSSVSQIGFILVGLAMQCLLGHHNALAVEGTILHIFNHSIIKMVLFPAAGIIHLSTHSFDLNEIRGFGRDKPLLALIMGVPMLSLAGLPLLNGYVSKTLLHESIVEYLHIAGESAWVFQTLEWLFLIAGGLTFAYMLKLFVCIFVEKKEGLQERNVHKKPKGKRYIAPASAAVLLTYLVVMGCLGLFPNQGMDQIAAFGRSFFLGKPPAHAVAYFSVVNLKGAFVSLTTGGAVYLVIVRKKLCSKKESGERAYFDPLPACCDLEFGVYRPVLTFLAEVLMVVAVFVDRIGFRILFRALPSVFVRWYRWVLDCRGRLTWLLTGEKYIPRPSLEQVVDDHHFGLYADHPQTSRGILHTFAFGLLLTGLGMVFAVLFVFLH